MSAATLDHKEDHLVQPIHHVDGEMKKDPYFDDAAPLKAHVYGDYIELPTGLPEEDGGLTVRAIIVGCLLGTICGASNIYLGLKTGFTFGAGLFGAIFGFAVVKALSKSLPLAFGGGYFGPKENCTVQTTATASAGLSTLFVAALPAMYRLNLLSPDGPSADVGKLIAISFISAYYGLFFAVPLRKWFVINQKLVFPSPFAAASTIASLHSRNGEAAAAKKAKIMMFAFLGAITWNVVGWFIPGLYNMHIFWWFHKAGCEGCWVANKYAWVLTWTPAFLGAGALSGLHASGSMLFGSITAYALIGPLMDSAGLTNPKMGRLSLSQPKGETRSATESYSTRYFLLFPAITMMTVASFAQLFYNWRAIYAGFRAAALAITKRNKANGVTAPESMDPAPAHEQVPAFMWVGGLLVSSVFSVVALRLIFEVPVGEGILALILAFIFSFVGIQSSGTTDTNPVGAIAKTSQFVFGGISRSQGHTLGAELRTAQTTNLLAGAVAGSAAGQAVDMVGDLKTGHLLRASPRTQFYAQAIGTFVGIFTGLGLFIFYVKAYPCIIIDDDCSFDVPSVQAWQAMAVLLTAPTAGIPTASAWLCLALAILSVIAVVLSNKLPARFAWIVPNFPAIGVAWILTSQHYSIMMVIGAILAHILNKKSPSAYEMWAFALASGLIAGEGIGGLVIAALSIGGVNQSEVASPFACPGIARHSSFDGSIDNWGLCT